MNRLIVSSLPGRLRLRDRALRDPARLAGLRSTVARWPHVLAAEANPKAGSLLIHYDAQRLERTRCEARAITATEKVLGMQNATLGVDETAAHAHGPDGMLRAREGGTLRARGGGTLRARGGSTLRVRTNRWAKRGMLASLTAALLLAAVGTKRWHALTGVLFLHALAAHLWIHRRHVFR